jgi:hypothetical protein
MLRKIVKSLALDEKELFSLAVYLPGEQLKATDMEKHRLLEEFDILVDRVTADTYDISGLIYFSLPE